MRSAIEFLNVRCVATKSPTEDEISVKAGRATLWSGPMKAGQSREIGAIRVANKGAMDVALWQQEPGRRDIQVIASATLTEDGSRGESDEVSFAADGAEYVLSYRLIDVSD
jgi:hypothetical protein